MQVKMTYENDTKVKIMGIRDSNISLGLRRVGALLHQSPSQVQYDSFMFFVPVRS